MNLTRGLFYCLAGLAVLGCSDSSPSSPVPHSDAGATRADLEDPLDALFAEWNNEQSPGCSVAAMRDGNIVHTGSYGMANLDHAVPIENRTIFHVASVSKQFTAAAVVLLAQENSLSLDDEVRQHIPELPDFGPRITIRHLIHHTSGLRDQWELLSMTGWRYSQDLISNADVLSVIRRQEDLNFEPGSDHLYSNTGYALLAEIVARVSGQSFRAFTTERLFEPLGMNDTFFRDDFREIVHDQAYGYTRDDADAAYRLSVTNFDTVGATSLLTTATDLMKWARNFEEPLVGGESFVEQMLVRGKLNDNSEIDYAFGLSHGTYRGAPTVSHSGGDAGYRSFLARFPEHRFNVAVLCNTPLDTGGKAFEIADLLIPEALGISDPDEEEESEPDVFVAVDVEELGRITGRFWNAEHASAISFSVDEGKLLLEARGTSYEMVPLSKTRFRFEFGPIVEFDAEANRVTTFVGGGNETTLTRIDSFNPELDVLRKYVGTYRSSELDVPYRLTLDEDNRLTISWLKQHGIPLQPHLNDVFVGANGTLVFQRDDRGNVTGFAVSDGRVRNMMYTKERSPANKG